MTRALDLYFVGRGRGLEINRNAPFTVSCQITQILYLLSRGERRDDRRPDPAYDMRDPHYDNRDPHYNPREPRYDPKDSRYVARDPGFDVRYDPKDPRYGGRDSHYDPKDQRDERSRYYPDRDRVCKRMP